MKKPTRPIVVEALRVALSTFPPALLMAYKGPSMVEQIGLIGASLAVAAGFGIGEAVSACLFDRRRDAR